MSRTAQRITLHAVLAAFAALTMLPFAFALNNSFRTNSEMYHAFFGLPESAGLSLAAAAQLVRGDGAPLAARDGEGAPVMLAPREALRQGVRTALTGYRLAWSQIRPQMINSLVVSLGTAAGVLLLSSVTAFVLSRQRYPGRRAVFFLIISGMMFPGVLTFVPGYMVVKGMGLLDTYWALLLPYIAGGQIFGIFVMKSFFDGLPEDLFEAARMDGAGRLQCYWHIVLPLSKPVLSVVAIMSILGTWNNFMWPFVTQPNGRCHVVASGLYVLATSAYASNLSTLFAAYMISSIPLLVLFVYATKPFIQGITSGAFKA